MPASSLAREAPAGTVLEPAAMSELASVVEINVNAHSLGIEVKKSSERINRF